MDWVSTGGGCGDTAAGTGLQVRRLVGILLHCLVAEQPWLGFLLQRWREEEDLSPRVILRN